MATVPILRQVSTTAERANKPDRHSFSPCSPGRARRSRRGRPRSRSARSQHILASCGFEQRLRAARSQAAPARLIYNVPTGKIVLSMRRAARASIFRDALRRRHSDAFGHEICARHGAVSAKMFARQTPAALREFLSSAFVSARLLTKMTARARAQTADSGNIAREATAACPETASATTHAGACWKKASDVRCAYGIQLSAATGGCRVRVRVRVGMCVMLPSAVKPKMHYCVFLCFRVIFDGCSDARRMLEIPRKTKKSQQRAKKHSSCDKKTFFGNFP
jgi:hypothetical protein